MFDSHIHTRFSTDSNMNIEEAIKRSNELNLGLVITEHMDINFPRKGKFIFNPDEYFKEYSKYRSDKLLLGIEMGMGPECLDDNRELARNYPFDYIIGSTHIVNNIDVYDESYYHKKEKKQAYEEYLNYMAECVKNHDFIDSLGHIDYIARYARFDDKELYYNDFKDLIDEVLKAVVEKEKSIELNTRRLRDKSAVKNLIDIYKRYYELGGRTITIGSDSHTPDTIGYSFGIAREIADMCNLKIVYYKERKIYYV
jgi:histidinol-phosphatase (PHP family)